MCWDQIRTFFREIYRNVIFITTVMHESCKNVGPQILAQIFIGSTSIDSGDVCNCSQRTRLNKEKGNTWPIHPSICTFLYTDLNRTRSFLFSILFSMFSWRFPSWKQHPSKLTPRVWFYSEFHRDIFLE